MNIVPGYRYGRPWGEGRAGVRALSYAGKDEGKRTQVIAWFSHNILMQTGEQAPMATRHGATLYHDPEGEDFCVIGWQQPLFHIEYPKIGREN